MKVYTSKFVKNLPGLFEGKTKFGRAFGGTIQTIEGSEANGDFLSLKVTDTEVIVQDYNIGANVGMGTGTSNSSRFGQLNEVKSTDLQVPFDQPLAINDGVDYLTVNDVPDEVVAERLALHAKKWVNIYDGKMSKELSDKAGKTLTVAYTEESVKKAFSDAYKEFVNNEVSDSVAWVAYVTSEVLDILVDSKLATTAKSSSVNIDDNTMYKYKNFVIEVVADAKFQEGEVIYFAADDVGVAGVGVTVARTLMHPDFAGVAIQAAGKLGKYIPAKNSKAIVKATLTETPEDPETPEA